MNMEFMAKMTNLIQTMSKKYASKKLTVSMLDFYILRYPDKTVITMKTDTQSADIGVIMTDILKAVISMIQTMDNTAKIRIIEKDVIND